MNRARLPAAFASATLAFLGSLGALQASGPDPAAETTRLLAEVDTPSTHSLVQDPVAKSKAAQQRAENARGAGDLQHATELHALALTWAQVAQDLVRAAAAEKQVADIQKTVADLEQKAVRTQALIEQTIARKGRAEQNLASIPSLAPSAAPTSKATLASPKPAKVSAPASVRAAVKK